MIAHTEVKTTIEESATEFVAVNIRRAALLDREHQLIDLVRQQMLEAIFPVIKNHLKGLGLEDGDYQLELKELGSGGMKYYLKISAQDAVSDQIVSMICKNVYITSLLKTALPNLNFRIAIAIYTRYVTCDISVLGLKEKEKEE